MERKLYSLFPTPVLEMQYRCNEDIRNALNNEEMNTKVDGYGIFSKDTYLLEKEIYKPLADEIKFQAIDIMREILSLDVDEVMISQSWVSHKPPGGIHESHTHGNSYFSGVYYFEEDTEPIEPITFQKNFVPGNFNTIYVATDTSRANDKPFAWDFYKLYPSPGTLIFFPSWLAHKVDINKSNKIRKSLAFNLLPKRLGTQIKLNELILYGRK